ncbi:AraC family transcriptional regulator [Paucibacter sp. XJ19-41]|uniref:AraC family transcriptional regulator n=1 Tax=Paucibacter sp. XJ19-41 TaxID=2927824 RepID=UPI00234B84AA|nr:AraC family transcriptional regulator [Paucibacter sp. XJ19-41]MDC6168702.1 AraC family transcriptional regulator [Paucibacter sp. XJ19-41]
MLRPTRIAILSFDGFNELDSFIALGLLNRLRPQGFSAELCGPGSHVTSMNGVTVQLQRPLEWANEAEVVLFGSGLYTRAIAENSALLDRLQLDPVRQLIGAQCSGTLLMARLGLLGDCPACTDLTTKPWVVEAGAVVLDEPFHARGPIATAGGCLASQYLATWVMLKKAGEAATREALHYGAPVGEKEAYVERLLARVRSGDASV